MHSGGRTHRRVFPRDAFEEVTDPALLLLLRVGQQKQLFGSGHVIVHCWRKRFKTDQKQGKDSPLIFTTIFYLKCSDFAETVYFFG